jgi:F-type H+-transporting ATPase subunit b
MADTTAPAAGMPQLDFSTFPNQIFWLVVAITALYFILSRVALPRIGSVLAERAGTIANDIAAAEQLKLQAAEAEAAYNRALDEARAQAQKVIAAARAEIQSELDAALARADAEIAARAAEAEARLAEIRAQAAGAVAEVARDLAAEIVAIFGVTADAARIAAAVDARLRG